MAPLAPDGVGGAVDEVEAALDVEGVGDLFAGMLGVLRSRVLHVLRVEDKRL